MKTHAPSPHPAPEALPPQFAPRSAPPAHKRHPALFPEVASRPSALLWVWILPQALLLFLNWRAWDLASGDMTADQRATALWIFGIECAIFAGGFALFAATTALRSHISRAAGAFLLLAATFYLSTAFSNVSAAIPASVREWILPPGQWTSSQFTLVGIGALYGAFRLLCPDREQRLFLGASLTLGAIAAPFAILLLLSFPFSMPGSVLSSSVNPMANAFLSLFIAAAFLASAGLLRVCVSSYVAARSRSPWLLAGVTFIVALALPLGGLATNAAIPFPANFQSPAIYALAILNGLLLCLPNFSHPIAHRAVWLAQCLLFPFTAYFFAVFLPALPLMPVGALFFGLGLFICAPSALFLLHGCRILDGAKAEVRDGRRWIPTLLAAGAMALGPALLTTQILRDRASLHHALDHLQYPDYDQPEFRGNLPALRSALINLRNFKDGLYLPLYSEFYNWLAFDNLLLPDQKLSETWQAFFGEPIPKQARQSRRDSMFWGDGARRASEILSAPPGLRPPQAAQTSAFQTVIAPAEGKVRALAQLTVRNPTSSPAEYRAIVHIPDGVFITGMWLTIAGERVAAPIFEERAALWVYGKITEVRPVPRDPAILRYIAPGTAELCVFPVDAGGTRFIEVEFTWPDNLAPAITVDGRPLDVPAPRTASALRDGSAAWVPPSALEEIAPLRRTAQPHVIIDISKNSTLHRPENLSAAIRHALAPFPDTATATVTFANYESRVFREGEAISVRELRAMEAADLLRAAGRFAGGFLEALAIKSALTRAQTGPAAHPTSHYPAVIVLRGTREPLELNRDQLPQFAALAPDQPFWWSLDPGATAPARHALDPASGTSAQPREVRLFQTDDSRLAAVPTDNPAFLTGVPPHGFSVFDPAKRIFVPVPTDTREGASAAIAAWTLARERTFQPSRAGADSLAALLDLARDAGVLVPSTAMMVVENQSQWKMLALTEKKTLKAHEGLAMQEPAVTPEPGVIGLLAAAALAGIAWRLRRRRCTA